MDSRGLPIKFMEAEMKGESDCEDLRRTRDEITGGGTSKPAKRSRPSFEGLVTWLEDIRSEGKKMLTEKNWAEAVSNYSDCINSAKGYQMDINDLNNTEMLEKYNRIVMSAYSNRAEANLCLLKYEDALHDADKALQIDPKHSKTFVRKGTAAHFLGFFEKACEAFRCGLAESLQEQPRMSNLLTVSSVALEQSRPGDYDLLEFFSRGCIGDIPSCADFVGPVEIRRVSSGPGRWGLFATRSLELGDLLLVSNPLAVVRHKTLNADGSGRSFLTEGEQKKLIEVVTERVGRSTLERARLYSLANKGEQEMEILSMKLFRPGSEWSPPDALKFEVDEDLIRNIAKEKTFDYVDVTRDLTNSESSRKMSKLESWDYGFFQRLRNIPVLRIASIRLWAIPYSFVHLDKWRERS